MIADFGSVGRTMGKRILMNRIFCVAFLVVFVISVEVTAKEWNGIVPCVTARKEAEKKLGERQMKPDYFNIYIHKKHRATVYYKQADKNEPEKDIVKLIIIYPEETITLKQYIKRIENFDREFRKIELDPKVTHVYGAASYTKLKDGFSIDVQKNEDDEEVIHAFWYMGADRSC